MGKGKIEKAIELAGNKHFYQKTLIGILALLWIAMNFIMLGPAYVYMDPVFQCKSTGDQKIDQVTACSMIEQCHIIDQFTLTAKLKLYCDRQDDRTGIQSIFSIGSFAGLIIMNMISDTKGRKISVLISVACMIVGATLTIIGGVYDIVAILMISQIISGFGGYATVSLSYILLADFCNDKYRQFGTIIVNSAWGFSTILLGVFYVVQLNWFYFLLCCLLLPLLVVYFLFQYFLIQSPYILMGLNKKEKTLKELKKMCKFNKKQSNFKQIEQIIQNQQEKTEANEASIKNVIHIIKKKENIKPILLLTLIYGVGNTLYYGIMYSIDTQGNGFGVNSMSSGGVQMLSFVYLGFFVTRLARRKGIAIFYTLAITVGMLFAFPAIKNNYLAVTLIICLNRLFSTVGYTMIACMQVESFTVQIQSTACGMIEALSLFGVLIAPIIVDFADNIGIDSIVCLCIIGTCAIWPNIFLKQTLPSLKKKQNPLLENFLNENSSQTLIFSKHATSQQTRDQDLRESILTEQSQRETMTANPQEIFKQTKNNQ